MNRQSLRDGARAASFKGASDDEFALELRPNFTSGSSSFMVDHGTALAPMSFMDLHFIGAAQTVTGSKHLVTTAQGGRVLLDCGLFQGHRRESIARNRSLGVEPTRVDAVVLSHAHIDHCGALPILVKRGYRGPIYTTPATADLCAAMLADAAFLQAADARYINHRIARDGVAMEPVEPLFDQDDVDATVRQIVRVPYHRTVSVVKGVQCTLFDAGHVFGSAVTVLDVDEPLSKTRLVYTGDLGRKGIPILKDPEVVGGADALISESTYGDRLHPAYHDMEGELDAIIHRVHARGGKIIIPSFAFERAQEIVLALKRLRGRGRLPRQPVYVDSPLTVQLTDIFKLHPECFDEEIRTLLRGHDSPFHFPELTYVSSVEDSMAIDATPGPSIVISASGMCEGGRVLHHLRAAVENPRNCVMIVGFQAEHTLGRRIQERRPRVKIFGVERELQAEVAVLEGFSAHADQNDLVDYAEETGRLGVLKDVVLVHGELPAQNILKRQLEARGLGTVHIPAPGESLKISGPAKLHTIATAAG